MKKFVAFLALLVVAFLAGGFLLPATVTVERSITINRPAATVFTLLNGFRTWEAWSPWARLDPAAEFTRSGPPFGVGARLDWTGDPTVLGAGSMKIVTSEPWSLVELRTDIGPQGKALTRYQVNGDRLGSRVTWQFETDVTAGQGALGGFVGPYFGVFLERWVGDDFERGLRMLAAYAEALPDQDFSEADIELVEARPMLVARVPGISRRTPEAIATALADAFGDITTWALESGAELTGQPMAVAHDGAGDSYRFEAAIPLVTADQPLQPTGRVEIGLSPAGKAVRIVHTGPYQDTLASYERLYAWMAAHGYEPEGTSWEHYVSDPASAAAGERITHIYALLGKTP